MSTSKIENYIIRCVTNLHAGAGDEDYGAIDKRVQRDVSNGRPAIFSSSLKGSFREYFEQNGYPNIIKGDRIESDPFIRRVFGSHHKEVNDKAEQGSYRFLTARLYSLPMKSNFRPYYNATCPAIISEIIDYAGLINDPLPIQDKTLLEKLANEVTGNVKVKDSITATSPIFVEDWKAVNFKATYDAAEASIIKKYFGEHFALIPDSLFIEYTESLPVIARNQLENGESKNLWYEEVVPSEARFGFAIIRPDDSQYFTAFNDKLTGHNIQIGANATIGYGLTKIYKA